LQSSYPQGFPQFKSTDRSTTTVEPGQLPKFMSTDNLSTQFDGLEKLMKHVKLAHLRDAERSKRAIGVGSVLFQFLAIQQELNEPLNLNGDLLADILDDRVVYCHYNGDKALEAMFASVNGGTSSAASADHMLNFKSEHAVWDPEFRPPIFRCDDAFRSAPTLPISLPSSRQAEEQHGN
jgi:hypothetical protein